jgi:hypothetical protein
MEIESVLLLSSVFDDLERDRPARGKDVDAGGEVAVPDALPAEPDRPTGSHEAQPDAPRTDLTLSTPSRPARRLRWISAGIRGFGKDPGSVPGISAGRVGARRRRVQWVFPE